MERIVNLKSTGNLSPACLGLIKITLFRPSQKVRHFPGNELDGVPTFSITGSRSRTFDGFRARYSTVVTNHLRPRRLPVACNPITVEKMWAFFLVKKIETTVPPAVDDRDLSAGTTYCLNFTSITGIDSRNSFYVGFHEGSFRRGVKNLFCPGIVILAIAVLLFSRIRLLLEYFT